MRVFAIVGSLILAAALTAADDVKPEPVNPVRQLEPGKGGASIGGGVLGGPLGAEAGRASIEGSKRALRRPGKKSTIRTRRI